MKHKFLQKPPHKLAALKFHALASLLCLLACATASHAQQQAQPQIQDEPPVMTAADAARQPQFRLSPGDTVELKFFYNKELNDTVQLRPDGYVSLQLVGEVPFSGKTIAEATRSVEKLYEEYLLTPSVTLEVRAYSSRKIFVGGEVEHPGVLALTSETTLLAAVIEVGGVKRTGNNREVILIRKSESGAPVLSKISLRNEHNQPSAAALATLQPFDVVLVPETRIARLNKWVDQYIRQMSPLVLTGGFSYFTGGGVTR